MTQAEAFVNHRYLCPLCCECEMVVRIRRHNTQSTLAELEGMAIGREQCDWQIHSNSFWRQLAGKMETLHNCTPAPQTYSNMQRVRS